MAHLAGLGRTLQTIQNSLLSQERHSQALFGNTFAKTVVKARLVARYVSGE
jgi:hypothetical protein